MALPGRVAGLLRNPVAEWQAIAVERDDVTSISQGYVSILALVPAASLLAGVVAAGGRFLGSAGITTAVLGAIVSWVLAIFASIASAVVIEKIASIFDGDGDLTQAYKLVAYSLTPFWLSGVFYALDSGSPLVSIGALWSVYLLYQGVGPVMRTPTGRVFPSAASSVLAILIVNVLLRTAFTLFKVPYMGF